MFDLFFGLISLLFPYMPALDTDQLPGSDPGAHSLAFAYGALGFIHG